MIKKSLFFIFFFFIFFPEGVEERKTENQEEKTSIYFDESLYFLFQNIQRGMFFSSLFLSETSRETTFH